MLEAAPCCLEVPLPAFEAGVCVSLLEEVCGVLIADHIMILVLLSLLCCLLLPFAAFSYLSQEAIDAERARQAVLPPLQSVLELTTAFRPPERSGGVAVAAPVVTEAAVEGAVAAEPVGRALPDGSGRLADGTWWEKKSGIERGKVGESMLQGGLVVFRRRGRRKLWLV